MSDIVQQVSDLMELYNKQKEKEIEDEKIEYPLPDVIIKIEGKTFRCECQCNVFRKSINDESKYRCNSCRAIYTGE